MQTNSTEEERLIFRLVADNMVMPVVELDSAFNIKYANKKALDLLWLEPLEIENGLHIDSLIVPEQSHLIHKWLRQVNPNDEPVLVSVRVLRSDKSELDLEVLAEPIIVNGIISGFTIYGINPSRRMVPEDKIPNERAAFTSVVEGSVAGIVIISMNHVIEYVNDRFCEITRRTQRELIGRDIREFIHPDSLEEISQKRVLQKKGEKVPISYEFKLIRGDGSIGHLLIHGTTITGSDGSTRTIEQVLDLTEQKMSRRALAESEERYRTLVETMGDGLAIDDADSRFVYVNNALCRMTGYRRDELHGKHISEILVDMSKEILASKLLTRRDGSNESYETRIRHKSGKLIPAIIAASPLFTEEDEYVGSFAIFTDISEQKRTERLLRATSERARLYLDVISHDIGNQHQAISGYAELLAETVDDPRAREILRHIHTALSKSEKIIATTKVSDLLDTSTMYERLLNDVLHNTVMDALSYCKNLTIETNYHVEQAYIQADELLEQLFLILLENACEHNTKTTNRRIWVDLTYQNNGYLVTISDNGPGIPDNMKMILFDPSRRYGGVGLHLASQIIEKYGGCIHVHDRVERKPEEGAMFKVWLPVSR